MERKISSQVNKLVGKKVLMRGWVHARRDHGRIIFIDLRDLSGLTQVVITPENGDAYAVAEKLSLEDVVEIEGLVKERPEKLKNPNIVSGDVELELLRLKVLNKAQTPPFPVNEDTSKINEELRLKYRYLDLRTERMAKNLKKRNQVIQKMRRYLLERGFIEVETPILTKSTPEGARDYVVPSRVHQGKFYALPQSPQQYKMLLQVAGIERYFQIARCFRDEDPRGDRQPEFTQLDIEMSFVTQEEILELVEDLYIDLVKEIYPEKKITKTPFPRITYQEAMEKYGSDRPDTRSNKNDKNELAFAWVVDFPVFEWKEEEKRWDAVHHPFTAFKGDWEEVKKDPAGSKALQYDLVLNGFEIGGGSIRIHDPKLLFEVFKFMGNSEEMIKSQFGHLFEAYKYGVPPLGGIAPGIDRFMMIMENEPSIREVIAFPKTGDARDPMMDSPSEITSAQKKELGLK